MNRALIIVDPQYDFMPGGALPVPDGDKIVPAVNELLQVQWDLVVVSQDWHPINHCSFKEKNGDWPIHCVQNTHGAEVHQGISTSYPRTTVTKGSDTGYDSYSVFGDDQKLARELFGARIDQLYICGLATDYCVKATVFDAVKANYPTFLVLDACRGVNVKPGDSERAIVDMVNAGAHVTTVARTV